MKKYIYSETELNFLPYKERIGFWSRFTIGVLLTGCFIVLQLTEVGDYEALKLKLKQMYNRSRNTHITTEPPILVRCCYTLPFYEFN